MRHRSLRGKLPCRDLPDTCVNVGLSALEEEFIQYLPNHVLEAVKEWASWNFGLAVEKMEIIPQLTSFFRAKRVFHMNQIAKIVLLEDGTRISITISVTYM